MIGVIDIGSNTIRLNVYSLNQQTFQLLFGSKEMVGLINYIEDNHLTSEGVATLVEVLNRFKTLAQQFNLTALYPFATASLRGLHNQSALLSSIFEQTGLKIEILSGEEEGKLGILGATYHKPNLQSLAFIDIGGGSTEVVISQCSDIKHSVSFNIGSLSLYKRFCKQILPTHQEIKNIKQYLKTELLIKPQLDADVSVIGAGGTMRATKKILNHWLSTDHEVIKYDDLKVFLKAYDKNQHQIQKIILKHVPDRIHTLLPGMIILVTLMKQFNQTELMVSTSGVREGYLVSRRGLI